MENFTKTSASPVELINAKGVGCMNTNNDFSKNPRDVCIGVHDCIGIGTITSK